MPTQDVQKFHARQHLMMGMYDFMQKIAHRNFILKCLRQYLRLLLLLPVLYLLFITFQWPYPYSIDVGLDPSWNYAINFLPNSGFIFGRDVVFTYGPLGYLLTTSNIGQNVIYATIFWLFEQIIFAGILIYLLCKSKKLLPVGLFIIAFVVIWATVATSFAGFYYIRMHTLLLTIGLLLYTAVLNNDKVSYIFLFLSGLLASLALFMKFDSGLAALSMVSVASIILIVRMRYRAWKPIIILASAYIAIIITLLIFHFKSIGNFIYWIGASLDIAGGYSAAMSTGDARTTLICGLAGLVLYIIFISFLFKTKSKLSYISAIFLIPVFLAFKHSFIRQDTGHLIDFFLFLPLVVSLFILFVKSRRELIASTSLYFAALILAIIFPITVGLPINTGSTLSNAGNFITGKMAWSNFYTLSQMDKIRSQVDVQSQRNLEKDRLPAEWISLIINSSGTVDVIPWEICYCPANGLNWNPKFVLQSYNTWTSSSDLRDSAHYTGKDAPDFLIAEFAAIDDRNVVLDTPASWKEIIDNYELLQMDDTGRLLLKKIPDKFGSPRAAGALESHLNTWIDVPKTDNLLFAAVDLKLNMRGLLVNTFYRTTPVYIDLLYESGRANTYRIIPDTAKNGLLINFVPFNYEEMAGLFTGAMHDKVTKFKISGIGTAYYNDDFTVKWEEAGHLMEVRTTNLAESTFAGKSIKGNIDLVNGDPQGPPGTIYTIEAGKEDSVTLQGWVVDENAVKTAGGVFLDIDSKLDVPAIYLLDRNDVAKYFNINDYRFCGFSASVTTSSLSKGLHTLSLKVITADGKGYYDFDQKINIDIK
jgi:hypothetical protein